jgi:hypothetical protein
VCPSIENVRWLGDQSVEGLLGEQNGVTGVLGELFDAGSDVDGVPDEGEFELPGARSSCGKAK